MDGTTSTVIEVNNSGKGAVYTGCTTAMYGTTPALYAANSAGGVEAYNTNFKRIALPKVLSRMLTFLPAIGPTASRPSGIRSTSRSRGAGGGRLCGRVQSGRQAAGEFRAGLVR